MAWGIAEDFAVMLCDLVCTLTAVFFAVTVPPCAQFDCYLLCLKLCHWACNFQKHEGTTFLEIIRHIPIPWNISDIILIFSVVFNKHNPTPYNTKFHTHNKILFWDILFCTFHYACSVILWMVLMNEDETTWLPYWLPPLSCHCADHSQFSKSLPLFKWVWLLFNFMEYDPLSINLFYASNSNIICSTNCKWRTAATLYTLETWFVSGIQL